MEPTMPSIPYSLATASCGPRVLLTSCLGNSVGGVVFAKDYEKLIAVRAIRKLKIWVVIYTSN